jgi:hypothetical protein
MYSIFIFQLSTKNRINKSIKSGASSWFSARKKKVTELYVDRLQNYSWTSYKIVHGQVTELFVDRLQNYLWTSYRIICGQVTKLFVDRIQNYSWTGYKSVPLPNLNK